MILVYAESPDGQIKKSAIEAVSYGAKTAQSMGTSCAALVFGNPEGMDSLGTYGADSILQINDAAFEKMDSQIYAKAIADVATEKNAQIVVLSHSSTGKSLLGRIAIRLNAGSVSGVSSIPNKEDQGISVEKSVFSGKALATYQINSEKAVLSLMGNSVKAEEMAKSPNIETLSVTPAQSNVEILEQNKQSGDIAPLPEAELVVSAGRGMKGPENWGIIEELANVLGATTACSRPVADSGWRPHHEHVGQTGIAIKPNLYIAAGISGAIQHLAGVNSSKCIVVINKDPEAPFFKAADYGICADLFDVVPRLTEAIKKVKA
ncbi:MAG: electron transfer flavoprotein subunit alpha/FixB family protein [Saprospiraceae bacterium]|nr:electron transfer flavoprotein subunit alpha/FixB family protein [Saprospiraceae bacterium]